MEEPTTPTPTMALEPTTDPSTSESTPLSKNAQKRLAKAARLAEQKKERRAFEKEKKKQKKRERAEQQQKEDGEHDSEGARKKARTDGGPRRPFGARIVVDLGFDDLMSENEIKSLTSQLAFTYSANRKAVSPFSTVLFTSLNGRTFTRLEGISNAAYKRWIDTEWWSESYERLWEGPAEDELAEVSEAGSSTGKRTNPKAQKPQTAPRESVVYLTADSNDELTELKEDETYIIGGICDHNRYKNLCQKKSEDTKIRSARLPIGTYLSELKTRKVLTVNQTFEILLKWVETRDWEQALYSVVPKRKFEEKDKNKVEKKATGKSENADDGTEKVVVEAEDVEEGRAEEDEESGFEEREEDASHTPESSTHVDTQHDATAIDS
ncbi:guanine-1-methyltransferase-domain-containing protein [Cristinia sonorae]|uniref:tRNA (guanine(9)-N1)-methyltransferase n=1 Tax=Cristinia sonorae TaxID=1940300 RepID=A0A8K0XM14_9AGAR|nr:guanine-1-methyltransferase-domain-containing protein [Cristinia sonorae]